MSINRSLGMNMSMAQFSPGLGALAGAMSSGSVSSSSVSSALVAAGVSGTSFSSSVSSNFSSSSSFSSSMVQLGGQQTSVPSCRCTPNMSNVGSLSVSGSSVATAGGYGVSMQGGSFSLSSPGGSQISLMGGGKGAFGCGVKNMMLPDGTNLSARSYSATGGLSAGGSNHQLSVRSGCRSVNMGGGAVQMGGAGSARYGSGNTMRVSGNTMNSMQALMSGGFSQSASGSFNNMATNWSSNLGSNWSANAGGMNASGGYSGSINAPGVSISENAGGNFYSGGGSVGGNVSGGVSMSIDVPTYKQVTEWKEVTHMKEVSRVENTPPQKKTETALKFAHDFPKSKDVGKVRGEHVKQASDFVDKNLDLLKKPGAKLDIAGLCSSPGTSDYNKHLGERRAQYTKNALTQALRQKGFPESKINELLSGKVESKGENEAKVGEKDSHAAQQPDRRSDVTISVPGESKTYTDKVPVTERIPVTRTVPGEPQKLTGSSSYNLSADASTAFSTHGGMGAFGVGSNDWGGCTLGHVGGAYGGASLYGSNDFSMGMNSSRSNVFSAMGGAGGFSSASSGFTSSNAQNSSSYISSTMSAAYNTVNSYNSTSSQFSSYSAIY